MQMYGSIVSARPRAHFSEPGATRHGLTHLLQVIERIRAASRRRRAYEDLLSRPDYILRDIGVSRSELLSRVRRPLL